MLPSFCNQTITRLRSGTIEARGSVIQDWSNPDRLEITGCSMQPASTSLSTDGRVLGISDYYSLFAPADADVQAGDRIEYNGKVYEIDGDIRVQPAASMLEHIQVTLKRYQG